ncbi:unnamed protein product, partial [Bubo scandiacus]
ACRGAAREVAAVWGLFLVLAGAGSAAGVLALLQPRGQPGALGDILAEELNKLLDAFSAEIKNLVWRFVSGGCSEVTAVCLDQPSHHQCINCRGKKRIWTWRRDLQMP